MSAFAGLRVPYPLWITPPDEPVVEAASEGCANKWTAWHSNVLFDYPWGKPVANPFFIGPRQPSEHRNPTGLGETI